MKTLPPTHRDSKKVTPASSVTGQATNPSPLGDIETDINDVEKLIKSLGKLPDAQMIDCLKDAADLIEGHGFQKRKSDLQLQLQKWLAGTLLNTMKEKLGHGKFGKWRKEHLENPGIMGERTSQRLMKHAEKYSDPRAMLEQLERSEKETTNAEDSAQDAKTQTSDGKKSRAAVLMASLTVARNRLRLFQNSGESLTSGQLTELRLTKDELDRFFDPILAPVLETEQAMKGGLES